MPRYFFHARDGARHHVDQEGMTLNNLEAARWEALAGAKQLLVEHLREVRHFRKR
jgi:hypothetical protein